MNFLKKLFSKKDSDDDDDYGEDEDDAAPDDDEDEDRDDEDGDDEDGEPDPEKAAKRKKLLIIGGAGAGAVAVIGGLAAFFLLGDETETAIPGAVVSVELPGLPGGGLTPPAPPDPGGEGDAAEEDDTEGGEKTLNELAQEGAEQSAGLAGVVVSSTPATAFDALADPLPEIPLTTAPVFEITQDGAEGPVPIVSADGLTAWRIYARDFKPDDRPRVAVIVTGLGLSRIATMAAIRKLPGGVTLAFSPYGEKLDEFAGMARERGHEILITLPLEPADFPKNDPGPLALLSPLPPEQNLQRLDRILALLPGHVGVIGHMGSRFSEEIAAVMPVMEHLKQRGILWVDNRASANSKTVEAAGENAVPWTRVDMDLGGDPDPASVDNRLRLLEEIARMRSVAVAVTPPLPNILERVAAWVAGLEDRKIALAPVSAVVTVQAPQ